MADAMTLNANVRATARQRPTGIVQDMLLIAGVLSSMVYVVADLLCALSYPGYSYAHQVISELSAIGAPTTELWAALMYAYAVLFIAFTIGVMRAGRDNAALKRSGRLMLIFLLLAPLWSFFPMHQRGGEFTGTDAGHILLGGVSVLLMTAIVATGASAFGRRFRIYSVATVTVVFVMGVATFRYVERMIDLQPTSYAGIIERICLYAFLLWIAVLAVTLLKLGSRGTQRIYYHT